MYTQYFGLTDKPFAISPDPRFLYMSELHREGLAHLVYGMNTDGCFILLTGDVGTGKTTICRCLLEQLPENADIAIILNPRLTARDLLKTMCQELGIEDVSQRATLNTFISRLNEHLLATHSKGRTTTLIIDEAQDLDMNVLEQLRLLTNLETNTEKLLRIVLIGQPELREMLNKPELSQINQRITSRYHLKPLESQEVEHYIHHRLSVAGRPSAPLFTSKAVKLIVKKTQGIPRLINVLCDRALLGAYAENETQVDHTVVKRAAKEIFANQQGETDSNGTQWILLSAILLLAIIVGLFNGWPQLSSLAQQAKTLVIGQTEVPQVQVEEQQDSTATPDESQTSQ